MSHCKPIRNVLATSGCNISSKILIAELGKLPLKFACLAGTSTCPATLLIKGQKTTCRVGQFRVLFCLPVCHFLPNSLATGQMIMLHAELAYPKEPTRNELEIACFQDDIVRFTVINYITL